MASTEEIIDPTWQRLRDRSYDLSWSFPRLGWPAHQSSVTGGLQIMFEEGEGADLYILCGRKEIPVHRAIVFSKAGLLVAECTGERGSCPPVDNYTMDLEHEDLLAVEVMIWFIYFNNYPHFQEAGEDGIFVDLRFDAHIKVYAIAKKYDIPAMALLAKKHFMHAVKWRWWTCLFLHCIPLIYETTPESDGGPRRLLVHTLRYRFTDQVDDKCFWNYTKEQVRRFPLFACDFLDVVHPRPAVHPRIEIPGSDVVIPNADEAHWGTDEYVLADFESEGHTFYDAALLQATPRDQKNKFCYLQVQTSRDPWAAGYYIAHARFGNVGEAGKVERPGETQEEAIREFKKIFKERTGLEWENRVDQPVKGKYKFFALLSDNYDGLDTCESKPLFFDVSKTSTSIETLSEDLERRHAASAIKSAKKASSKASSKRSNKSPQRLPSKTKKSKQGPEETV